MDKMVYDKKIVNLLPHKDISAAAFSTAYVNMENWRHAEIIITTGANGAGTKAVTVKEAKDTSGTSAATLTALTHYYSNITALGSASIANDTMAKVSMSSGTFNIAASTNNQVYSIPIDADELNGTSAMTHLGVGIATTSAACIAGAIVVLSEPRYGGLDSPTALD